jgi:membrane protein implicated in regulation of membrane protease activity
MRIVSVVLACVLSGAPALAQQPIHAAVNTSAAAIANDPQPVSERSSTPRWIGLAVAAAGSTVAILGATAFRSEDTTSGNTPPGGFQQCEALKSNPVYAGNQCDILKGPNLSMVWSGVAAAAAGVTLFAVASGNRSVQVGPRGIRFQQRVTF